MLDILLSASGHQIAIALGIFVASAGYHVAKYLLAPEPLTRQEAVHGMYSLLMGFVTFLLVTFVVFAQMGKYAMVIARAVYGDNQEILSRIPRAGESIADFQSTMTEVSSVYYRLWERTRWSLMTLYSTIVGLQMIPITAPLGIYLMQASQYFQWVSNTALFESYTLYVLSNVARISIALSGLGAVLLVSERTRAIGAFIVSTCVCTAVGLYVYSGYASYIYDRAPWIDFTSILTNPSSAAQLIGGAFDLGKALQEFCVSSAIALASISAAIGGITYMLSRVYQSIHV